MNTSFSKSARTAVKWLFFSLAVGVVCGFAGALFHKGIEGMTELRALFPALLFLLPLAGILIFAIYRFCRISSDLGTGFIIESLKEEKKVPLLLAPAIALATLLSHLFGASVGREGAALQLGGTLGHHLGRAFHFDKRSIQIACMCGMAGCFAAMFGTPFAAAFFVPELVIDRKNLKKTLFELPPCLISALCAAEIAKLCGCEAMYFSLNALPSFTLTSLFQTLAIAFFSAILGILFCLFLHKFEYLAKKIKNGYLRIALGGCIFVLIVSIFRLQDYTGAGTPMIERAIGGSIEPYAFLLKLILTVLCVGTGFRGGEIVPSLFIGSGFGCAVAPLLGMSSSGGAAIGLTAFFSAVTNCPIATILLSLELFSTFNLPLFAVASIVSFLISIKFSLYKH